MTAYLFLWAITPLGAGAAERCAVVEARIDERNLSVVAIAPFVVQVHGMNSDAVLPIDSVDRKTYVLWLFGWTKALGSHDTPVFCYSLF